MASLRVLCLMAMALALPFGCSGRRQSVEEVTRKQLEAFVVEEDYLAVFWCKSTIDTVFYDSGANVCAKNVHG
jgi:hypothetical protein